MFDIDERHLAIVKKLLALHVSGCRVKVFGSRVTGNAKSFSDLDLSVECDERMDFDKLRLIKEAFEESDLLFRVDVLDWHSLSNNFKSIIESQHIALYIDEVSPNGSSS